MADSAAEALASAGFWGETWRELRRRPKFVIAAALIAFIIVVAVVLTESFEHAKF